VLSKVARR